MKTKGSALARLDKSERVIADTIAQKRRQMLQMLNLPEDATEEEVIATYQRNIAFAVHNYEAKHGQVVPIPVAEVDIEGLPFVSDATLIAVCTGSLIADGYTLESTGCNLS